MYFIYLDESGNTGMDLDNSDQPIHFISGIIVHESSIQEIDKKITQLYNLFLPYSQNFDFEFHGIDIIGGKRYFKEFSIEQRLNIIEELVKIFIKYNIQFISYGLLKKDHKRKYSIPYHPHIVCFNRLIKDIDRFLTEKNEKGLIIMDKNDENKQNIINEFQSYKLNGIGFRGWRPIDLKNIIDTIYYTESYNSQLIQLADVVGYIYASHQVFNWNVTLEEESILGESVLKPNYVKQKIFEQIPVIIKQSYATKIE